MYLGVKRGLLAVLQREGGDVTLGRDAWARARPHTCEEVGHSACVNILQNLAGQTYFEELQKLPVEPAVQLVDPDKIAEDLLARLKVSSDLPPR